MRTNASAARRLEPWPPPVVGGGDRANIFQPGERNAHLATDIRLVGPLLPGGPLGTIVASKQKKKSPRAKPASAVLDPAPLKLRTTQGEFKFEPTDPSGWQKKLQRAAMEWTYVVRNRQRWRTEDKSSASINDRARKQLMDLGLPTNALASIAECGVVEVVVPYQEETFGLGSANLPMGVCDRLRYPRDAAGQAAHRLARTECRT